MTGYEKAKKAAEAIKAKNKVEIEVKEEEKKEAENALAEVQTNPVLMQLYKDNAKVGTANLGGQSPLLKVHKLGKSTTNQLADGSEPNDGWFFYKSTGEQFESVECHILTISKGFRVDGLNKKDVFNQIMAGAIVNGGDLKPFIMYLTGTKLKKMWEFGKEASKYTNAKPVPIPMFAMRVKLTTEKQKTDYGPTWIINFEIMKDEKEFPIVVADPGVFTFLRDQVDSFEDTLASLIAVRSAEEGEESPPPPVDVENEEVPF